MRIFWILLMALFAGNNLRAAEYMVLRTGGNARIETLLQQPFITGLSVIYNWPELEPHLGQYDFSAIERDLAYVRRFNKTLMIMVRDKSFANNPLMPVPPELADYVVGDSQRGYIAKRWEAPVNEAFRNLILALGARFNQTPGFRGFKTSETAPGLRLPSGTQRAYIRNLSAVIASMGRAFPDKETYFYMNWGPGGIAAMTAWANAAQASGVGLGGPDIHPDVDMPSYKVFRRLNGRVPIMMDVQYSNYSHATPEELKRFGEEELGADVLVWLPFNGVDYTSLLAR
jgi:hypothetical protein